MVLGVLVVAVANTLLILVLGEDRVRAARQQHHSHEEWDYPFIRHVAGDGVAAERSRCWSPRVVVSEVRASQLSRILVEIYGVLLVAVLRVDQGPSGVWQVKKYKSRGLEVVVTEI